MSRQRVHLHFLLLFLAVAGITGWLLSGLPAHTPAAAQAPEAVVEEIAEGDPFDLALGGGFVHWTELPSGEFCSSVGAVKSVSPAGGPVSTHLSDCNLSPANVVADDNAIYYAEWQSDRIRRLPAGGGTPVTIADADGLIFHRALDLDESYLFFGDELGIRRVPKDGGSVSTLAAEYDSHALAVDDEYAYWTERSPGGGGAIRRVAKAGGSVQTLLSGSALDDPAAIAVDATHVYWTELGSGQARRMPKAGGTPLDLVPAQPLYMGGDIAVNDTHVYWLDTTGGADGRLRRVPKGGGAVDNLALGLFGPTGVNLSATHVYWGDSDGIWRLPVGADPTAVDLTLSGMEVTQAIQNLANDVPLVADKTTYVRVYPAVDVADTPNVTAQLHGTRGGTPLPGSPLSPVAPTVYVRTAGTNRATLDQSFTFWIPPSWRSGTVTFRAEINPTGTIPETDSDNNSLSRTMTFDAKAPICLGMYRVRTAERTASMYDAGFWEIVDWVKVAYPVPDVRIYSGSQIEETQVCWAGPIPYPCGGPYEIPDDGSWVLAKLWTVNLFTNDPGECNDQLYYYGMVHPTETDWYGLGYRPGDEALGVMSVDPAVLGASWPGWYLPAGGSIMAHEVGHNLGRRHVDCPAGGPDGPDGSYPYNACDIGPDDPGAYYGFDVLDQTVIPPTAAGDLMSYSHWLPKPHWLSDYTYRGLNGALPATRGPEGANPLARAVAQAEQVLALTGIVTPTLGTGTFNYGYVVDEGLVSSARLERMAARLPVATAQAPYSLLLVDGDGDVLNEVTFDHRDEGDAEDADRSFTLLVPFDPLTEALVLMEGGRELDRRPVSANAPTVQLLSPNGGESFADELVIRWEGNDADGEALLYTVQYSPDAGATWETLANEHTEETLTVADLRVLAGSSQALVRVIASDGVRTGSDSSDAVFTVAGTAPDVHISRPSNHAVFDSGVQVIAIGRALDAEDGQLSGSALTWRVDGEVAGSGEEIALDGLSPGWHTVSLTAEDGDGGQAATSVRILVGGSTVYLPATRR